jgi:hypothetical protein
MVFPVHARRNASHLLLTVRHLLTLLCVALLAGCGGGGGGASTTPLTVSSTSLAGGTVGVQYSASLMAAGGTPPYTWTLTNGSLPAGLTLNTDGVIAGVPDATADNVPLTFQASDAGGGTVTANLTLNVAPATSSISIVLSTQYAALTPGQQIQLTATTNDTAGVNWSVSPAGATLSSSSTQSGGAVTVTAPTAAGLYTVTATSITDGHTAAAAAVGVTGLTGVYTYHNDLSRSGTNSSEYGLTPANVNTATFGKLFSCTVDGAVYAQPLWVAGISIGGATHNVVFVATEHDGVFAFDADQTPCMQLWSATLLDAAHGATAGEQTVISAGPNYQVGAGNGDLTPETGITGTPVIDPASGTLYVVSKSVDAAGITFYQRLHALDLTTGAEKTGSPVTIAATFPGSGDGGTLTTFNAQQQLQRAGLALVNGTVYITWASHEDVTPYYGWIIGYTYNGTAFTQSTVANVAPDAGEGGIWMSGGTPAADTAGNLYLLTGNGQFDASGSGPGGVDFGDSLLQLTPGLAITQYYTPSDQLQGLDDDQDFGAGGPILIDLPTGSPVTQLVSGGGKDGYLVVADTASLGGYDVNNTTAWQRLSIGGGLFSTPAYWNGQLFVGGLGVALQAYQMSAATAQLSPSSAAALTAQVYAAAPTPSVSAQGASNGIVWVIDNSQRCRINTTTTPGGPAVLAAYDASNVANLLWTSALTGNDDAGNAVRYTVPTIANGKVYIGTRGTGSAACSLTSTTGELDVYGLK